MSTFNYIVLHWAARKWMYKCRMTRLTAADSSLMTTPIELSCNNNSLHYCVYILVSDIGVRSSDNSRGHTSFRQNGLCICYIWIMYSAYSLLKCNGHWVTGHYRGLYMRQELNERLLRFTGKCWYNIVLSKCYGQNEYSWNLGTLLMPDTDSNNTASRPEPYKKALLQTIE